MVLDAVIPYFEKISILLDAAHYFGYRHTIWDDLTNENWTRVLELEISRVSTDQIHSERVRSALFNGRCDGSAIAAAGNQKRM